MCYESGMDTKQNPEAFISLRVAAARLGVPAAWLKSEAEANRIPHLRAGRRILVNVRAVRAALIERSGQPAGGGGQ